MNYQELSELFTDCLKKKLLGTKHNDREICDVSVDIYENSYEDEGGGFDYDEIKIKVKTLSLKGKNSKWENYYIV